MSKSHLVGRFCAALAVALLVTAGSALANTFTVNSLLDTADAIPGNGSCATAGGQCTLRAAIQEANALAAGAPHTIQFSVAGTIQVNATGLGPLPTITRAMTINGGGSPSSGSSYTTNATFTVVLDGKTFNAAGNGFLVDLGQAIPAVHPANPAQAVTIKGLVIGGFSGAGVQFVTGYNTLQGCFIGTNAGGTGASATTANGTGVGITATAGNNALDGHNLVGGSGNPAFTNLISGNTTDGVDISGQSDSNKVQGNVIGTNAAGTAALPNGDNGVWISGASKSNLIGGNSVAPFEGNLISGNDTTGTGAGVLVAGVGASGNMVYGNRIGTNALGTLPIPNGAIIPPVTGTNGGDGVQISGGADTNVVGSYLNNQGNVISGNFGNGVYVTGASGDNNVVAANYVGTTGNGITAMGNHCDGILVTSNGNRIGGTNLLEGNVVGGSLGDSGCGGSPRGTGIHIKVGTGNQILQNAIGIEPNTDASLANAGPGIWIEGGGATGNKIGNGLSTGGNMINFNGALGISLGNGTTPNTNVASFFTGPNNYMNYPVLTSVVTSGGQTVIQGTFDYPSNLLPLPQTYDIEFFSTPAGQLDPTGHGEGAQWEGVVQVITDPSGHTPFTKTLIPGILAGRVVAAIATDINTGNSSEFSGNFVPTPVELTNFRVD